MNNKVRWVLRYVTEGDNTVEVYENDLWKPYTQSKCYMPDSNGFSKGYLTFINCIKQSYITNTPKNLRDV